MIDYKCNVIIADAPHRNHLYLEIWIDEKQFGEVYFDGNEKPVVEIYPENSESAKWQIDFECLQKIMTDVTQVLNSLKEVRQQGHHESDMPNP